MSSVEDDKCPNCDGSGSYPDPRTGEQTQCEWCHMHAKPSDVEEVKSGMDYGDIAAVAKETRTKVRAWKKAYAALRKASVSRSAVGPHSSRARLTSANARYGRAAEAFDRVDADLREWAQTVDPVDVDALRNEEAPA